MKKLFLSICVMALFYSCHNMSSDLYDENSASLNSAEQKLGLCFDRNHDWTMSSTGSVMISAYPQDITTDSIFIYDADPFADSTAAVLYASANESNIISYELPSYLQKVFVACKESNGLMRSRQVESDGGTVDFTKSLYQVSYTQNARTRSLSRSSDLEWQPTLNAKLLGDKGWNDTYALIDRGSESRTFTYDEFDHFNKSFTNFFKEGHYNNRILYTYENLRTYTHMTVGNGGGEITLTAVHKQSNVGQMFGYYYFEKGEDRNIKTVKKYVFSDKIYKVENKANGCTQNSYRLIYFDQNGNASYTFPEGTVVGLFTHVTDLIRGEYVDFYAEGEMNYDISEYLNQNGYINDWNIKQGRTEWKTLNHVVYANRNGIGYVGFEDYTDFDLNDLVLMIEGNVESLPDTPARDFSQGTDDSKQWHTFTFAFEDTKGGDYDLNDVVLQVWLQQRYIWGVGNRPCLNAKLVAVGAADPIHVYYRDEATGEVTALFDGMEVHDALGISLGEFANTETLNVNNAPVSWVFRPSDYYGLEKVVISKQDFYIVNENTGDEIHTPASQQLVGTAPYALCIPIAWSWPKETVSVTRAFGLFGSYASNHDVNVDWYLYPNSGSCIDF